MIRSSAAITAGLSCGHTKYTGVYAIQYSSSLDLQGTARSVTTTVASTGGRHNTYLSVEKRQRGKDHSSVGDVDGGCSSSEEDGPSRLLHYG
jgi:hypothetical protein